MSKALAKLARLAAERERDRMRDEERAALDRIAAEAADAGSSFTYPRGGRFKPSTVLGVLRRDGFKCKGCGEPGNLTVEGGSRKFEDLRTVCRSCAED